MPASNEIRLSDWYRAAALLIFLVIIGTDIYGRRITPKTPMPAQSELEHEFTAIVQQPSATQRGERYSSRKSGHALVGAGYSSTATFEEIRTYYMDELKRRGWRYKKDSPIRDWGRDFGGRTITFCKGRMTLSLQYAGERADYGWTYALDLSWGLESMQQIMNGDICK